MRLVVVARRGAKVAHFAGMHGATVSTFCGQVDLAGVDLARRRGPTDQWWIGSPAQAVDDRLMDRRRPCATCLNTLEAWAVDVGVLLAPPADHTPHP